LTIFDFRCDRCGNLMVGPARGGPEQSARHGVRFAYHPGDPSLLDNSSMVCTACWVEMADVLGTPVSSERCAICDDPITESLVVQRAPAEWRLCVDDAVDFLNSLRTVDPKLDRDSFALPLLDAIEKPS